MNKILVYYSFILVVIMTVSGFLGAVNYAELLSAILFFPLALYLFQEVSPRRKKVLILPEIVQEDTHTRALSQPKKQPVTEKPITLKRNFDVDRRMFIKLVGSAGLSLFILSLFTKRAHGAFFGSVPGPGTVALKDTSGAQIDPAKHHPTDGYKIAELDDSSPAYYGFVDRDGAWFILKEDSTGAYRYVKGTSSFSTNWTNRASLTYDYYHNIF